MQMDDDISPRTMLGAIFRRWAEEKLRIWRSRVAEDFTYPVHHQGDYPGLCWCPSSWWGMPCPEEMNEPRDDEEGAYSNDPGVDFRVV